MVKRGLGKGLGALIPTFDENEERTETKKEPSKPVVYASGVIELDINEIDVNPNQPRKNFDAAGLNDLAASIKTHGVLQPITVVKAGDRYMIVSGERRYRASKQAGKRTIPAQIKDYSSKEIKELALIENLQREDLNPVEIARGFKELLTEYSFTQDMLAERLGKPRATVANYLRLLSLSPKVLAYLENGEITMGHAKVICGVENKEFQERLAICVVKYGYNVRKLEETIKEALSPKSAKTKQEQTPELKDLIKQMQNCFGTKVTCLGTDKKGRIIIDYYSRDDLDRIYEFLK